MTPKILARLAKAGRQSTTELCRAFGIPDRSMRRIIAEMLAGKLIQRVFIGRGAKNARLYGWELREKKEFPHIGAGEWVAPRATGTRPSAIHRLI